MKTIHRISKAIAVVIILSFGLVYNLEKRHPFLTETFSQVNKETGIAGESDMPKSSGNNIFVYTGSIIKTSIQHLISKI